MEKTWMDIWKEWIEQSIKLNIVDFYDWLNENYEVPQKKQNVVNSQQNDNKCGL
jgi:superfamily I DNA/RNA helicase